MNIAFDFDGTITKVPHIFKELIYSFSQSSNNLYLITGTNINSLNELINELISYDIDPKMFVNIICKDEDGNIDEVNKWKYDQIDKLKIRLYFENRNETANYISELCTVFKLV